MDNNKINLKEICARFDIDTNIELYGNGHINDTYLCTSAPKIILQRINKNVFKNPEDVMENIVNVTKHLQTKIKAAGGNPSRETLTVIYTKDGKSFLKTNNGDYFRMYKFIENSVSCDLAEDLKMLENGGAAFGKFQAMLSDFPAHILHETIKDFHNTPKRFNAFKKAVENDCCGRAKSVQKEIEFAYKYQKYASAITDKIKDGSIPLRVTHNDTKLNNVLFDADTLKGLCVIDLDTVMPGSLLFDYGDALRFAASSGSEDERDIDKIWFDLNKFTAFTKGFLTEMSNYLTKDEIELMPVSALLMTYECGIRFLADYLNGDTYFKIHREGHNADRCRTQFKLVWDIEKKIPEMKKIIQKILGSL